MNAVTQADQQMVNMLWETSRQNRWVLVFTAIAALAATLTLVIQLMSL